MADQQSTLTVVSFALTILGLFGWAGHVWRSRLARRRIYDDMARAFADMGAALVGATEAMRQFGATMDETRRGMEAQLSADVRAHYEALVAAEVPWLDAMCEAAPD